jgi:hypothetical protein
VKLQTVSTVWCEVIHAIIVNIRMRKSKEFFEAIFFKDSLKGFIKPGVFYAPVTTPDSLWMFKKLLVVHESLCLRCLEEFKVKDRIKIIQFFKVFTEKLWFDCCKTEMLFCCKDALTLYKERYSIHPCFSCDNWTCRACEYGKCDICLDVRCKECVSKCLICDKMFCTKCAMFCENCDTLMLYCKHCICATFIADCATCNGSWLNSRDLSRIKDRASKEVYSQYRDEFYGEYMGDDDSFFIDFLKKP